MENILAHINRQQEKIKENIEEIRQKLSKIDKPIFIELIGTPKSGKTTLLKCIEKLFNENGITCEAKQETAEYNPIQDKDTEEYNIWMFMEIMKNISADTSNSKPRIIIYDRGMLDRIPWLDIAVGDKSIPMADNIYLKQLFHTKFFQKYRPLAYNLMTSPEISIKRKGKEGRLVNRKVLSKLNEYLTIEEDYMKKLASKYTTIQTDSYQGNIQTFIIDMTEKITKDIKEKIKEIVRENTEGERPSGTER